MLQFALVANLGFRDPVAQSMQALHWLPVIYRIKYKLCLVMFEAVNGRSPDYIIEALVPTSSLPNQLRSSTSGAFDVPRVRTQFGRRAFSIAGPAVWNDLSVVIRTADNIKRNLKAHLFHDACTR